MSRKELIDIKGFDSNPRAFYNVRVMAEIINSKGEISTEDFYFNCVPGIDIKSIINYIDIELWLEGNENECYCNNILHIEADIEYD